MELIIVFIEILLAVLLILMITYSVKLNRNIAQMQRSKIEMETMLERFVGATNRAQQTLDSIKKETQTIYKSDHQTIMKRLDDITQQMVHLQANNHNSTLHRASPMSSKDHYTNNKHDKLSKTLRNIEESGNQKTYMPNYQKKALLQELRKAGIG